MKKYYCGLAIWLCYGNCSGVSSSSLTIPINIAVPTVCEMHFNVPNITLLLIYGQVSSALTTLTISCTNGQPMRLAVSSKNNWSLLGKYSGESIAYSMLFNGGGQTQGASLSQTWSGGVVERIVMQGTATAAQWIVPLQITTAEIPESRSNDSYFDQVLFTISY